MLQVLSRRIRMMFGLVEEMLYLEHLELLNWDYHWDVTIKRRLGITLIGWKVLKVEIVIKLQLQKWLIEIILTIDQLFLLPQMIFFQIHLVIGVLLMKKVGTRNDRSVVFMNLVYDVD